MRTSRLVVEEEEGWDVKEEKGRLEGVRNGLPRLLWKGITKEKDEDDF